MPQHDEVTLKFGAETADAARGVEQLATTLRTLADAIPDEQLRSQAQSVASAFEDASKKIQAALKSQVDGAAEASGGLGKLRESMGSLLAIGKQLLPVLGVAASAELARRVVMSADAEERLVRQLQAFVASREEAEEAFRQLEELGATPPFGLDQWIEAFTRLKTVGIDPSIERLRALGDFAVAVNRDLGTVTAAFARAALGEYRALKQLGIDVEEQAGRLQVRFAGMTRDVEDNGRAVVSVLEEIARTNFAGLMDDQAKTLAGSLGLLKLRIENVAEAIAQGGLLDALSRVADDLSRVVESSGRAESAAERIGRILGAIVDGLRGAFGGITAVFDGVVGALFKVGQYAAIVASKIIGINESLARMVGLEKFASGLKQTRRDVEDMSVALQDMASRHFADMESAARRGQQALFDMFSPPQREQVERNTEAILAAASAASQFGVAAAAAGAASAKAGAETERAQQRAKVATDDATRAIREQIAALEERVRVTAKTQEEAQSALADLESRRAELVAKGALSLEESEELVRIESQLFDSRKKVVEATKDASAAMLDLDVAQAEAAKSADAVAQAWEEFDRASAELSRNIDEVAKGFEVSGEAFSGVGATADEVAESFRELQERSGWTSDLAVTATEAGIRIEGVGRAADDAAQSMERVAGATERVASAAEEATTAEEQARLLANAWRAVADASSSHVEQVRELVALYRELQELISGARGGDDV